VEVEGGAGQLAERRLELGWHVEVEDDEELQLAGTTDRSTFAEIAALTFMSS
jgi:hypothetical protein